MVRVKALFPYNYYHLRQIVVKADETEVARVGHGETVELADVKGKKLKFKLDYHKAELELPDRQDDVYVILYFDFRNYFPFNITDVAFRNALRAKIVSKEEFDSFDESFYKSTEGKRLEVNGQFFYTFILGLLFSLGLIALPFVYNGLSEPDKDFVFFIGILTTIGFVLQLFRLKKSGESQYYTKILAFGILTLILAVYLNIALIVKIIASVVALSMIMISFRVLTQKVK